MTFWCERNYQGYAQQGVIHFLAGYTTAAPETHGAQNAFRLATTTTTTSVSSFHLSACNQGTNSKNILWLWRIMMLHLMFSVDDVGRRLSVVGFASGWYIMGWLDCECFVKSSKRMNVGILMHRFHFDSTCRK